MSVLLIDFETSGLDTKEARIIEIGAMVASKDFTEVEAVYSQLVWDTDYPALTPEVQKITGINDEMLESAVSPQFAIEGLLQLVKPEITEVIAYNSKYDEAVMKAEVDRHDLTLDPRIAYLLSKDWLCAMEDLETNYAFKCWKLSHLALDYGVPVDPRELHRAVNDVELTRKLLVYAGANVERMRKFKDSPWVYVQAMVKGPWEDGGVSTGHAKAYGFNFSKAKGDPSGKDFGKTWVKRVKEQRLQEELASAPFEWRVLE